LFPCYRQQACSEAPFTPPSDFGTDALRIRRFRQLFVWATLGEVIARYDAHAVEKVGKLAV